MNQIYLAKNESVMGGGIDLFKVFKNLYIIM